MVWEYINPEGNFGVVSQGNNPQQNNVFRTYRYGPSFPGFEGRDMTPSEPLEGPDVWGCELYPSQDSTSALGPVLQASPAIQAFPNPATSRLTLSTPQPGTWDIYNNTGQLVFTRTTHHSSTLVDCASWPEGLYVVAFHPRRNDFAPSTLKVSISH